MTDEATANTKISFRRGAAGVMVSVLFYLLGSAIIGAITSVALYILGLRDNLIAQTVQAVVVTIVGMWFSRSATDWTLKRYSGRGVFIIFLALTLIVCTAATALLPFTAKLAGDFVQSIVFVGAAYYWFLAPRVRNNRDHCGPGRER